MGAWDVVTDIGSTVMDVGSDVASTAVDLGGQAFSAASGYAGEAFTYINDHPEVANVLGGIAAGVGEYYNAEQQREQTVRENRKDRQLRRDLANQKIDAAQIAPGNINDYGSYRGNVTNGLISNGMVANNRRNK